MDDASATIEVTDKIARRIAELILHEAAAAGFHPRPGREKATTKAALTKWVEGQAGHWIITNMHRKGGTE